MDQVLESLPKLPKLWGNDDSEDGKTTPNIVDKFTCVTIVTEQGVS